MTYTLTALNPDGSVVFQDTSYVWLQSAREHLRGIAGTTDPLMLAHGLILREERIGLDGIIVTGIWSWNHVRLDFDRIF